MVNALKTDCFPLFFRRFPVTKQSVNWCLREFSLIYLMFTARLAHGIQVVFCCFPVTKQRIRWSFQWLFLHFLEQWMRAKCQKTACSSAFTSWLTLEKHGVFLDENRDAMLSRMHLLSRLFCICCFSISMVSYMHFEMCCVELFPNFVVVMFSSLWVRSCAATFKMIFKWFNIVDRRTWFPPWFCPQQ